MKYTPLLAVAGLVGAAWLAWVLAAPHLWPASDALSGTAGIEVATTVVALAARLAAIGLGPALLAGALAHSLLGPSIEVRAARPAIGQTTEG